MEEADAKMAMNTADEKRNFMVVLCAGAWVGGRFVLRGRKRSQLCVHLSSVIIHLPDARYFY